MNPLMHRKLRFSDVVYAIDTTPKVVRNWLQRNQVKLSASETDGGWREFNVLDVAILALVRKCVDFGMQVEDASNIANAALESGASLLRSYKNTPPQALAASFNNRALIAWKDGDEWKARLIYTNVENENPDAFLTIMIGEVLDRAFQRAFSGKNPGEDQAEGFGAALRKLAIEITDESEDR